MTPTARTKAWLESHGWIVGVVERWNPHSRTRNDLFGMFDLLAFQPGSMGVVGVQATSGANHANRVAKIRACDLFPCWLADPARRALVVSWGVRRSTAVTKSGRRSRRRVWTVRAEQVTQRGAELFRPNEEATSCD